MDTTALITIDEVVNGYIFGYRKTTDAIAEYTKHAIDCLRNFSVYHSLECRNEKVSVSALGIIEMPSDCLNIKDVCVAYRGEWWSMTLKPEMVNTTTTTSGVEGQDTDFGEGVLIPEGVTGTYGTRGGINDYYYSIDWKARRIFTQGAASTTVLLRYVSSGIGISGTTYVSQLLVPVMENYFLWKETYWMTEVAREREYRKQDYIREELKLRGLLNSLSASQWNDLWYGSYTPSIKR